MCPEKSVLFTPVKVGPYEMKNRIVMSPMTRCRAGRGGIPGTLNALYCEQGAGADLVFFGRPFIGNPDLPARLEQGAPLNDFDPATLSGGDGKGCTDCPAL